MTTRSDSTLARWLIALFIILLTGLGCTRSDENTAADQESSAGTAGGGALRDGVYAVLWEATTRDSADLLGPRQVILPYDRKYTGSTETEPRTYLAIDTSSPVPLILETQPETQEDGTGRSLLSVTLAREYVGALEEFTTEHLGERAAIVLDGEVVTMHKIRDVIREGKIQISRCDGNSCEVLRARLAD